MNREILRFLNHQRSKVTSGQRRIIIIKIIISSAISMRTILSKVILERVSEGWRKKQGEGGGGGRASRERRSTFRGKAKWSTKLGYETRRSYFLWRVPLRLAKTGKKTSISRSSNDTLNRSRPGVFSFFFLSLTLVNIQSTKYYTNEKHFSRGGNNGPRHDWSIEERDFGKNSQERGRGFRFFESKKYRGEMYPLLFVVVTKMKNQFDDA